MNSNTSNMCNIDINYSCWHNILLEINREYTVILCPIIALMFTFMLIGFSGNTLVILTYTRRREKSSANIYVMFLAILDWLACVVIHPYVIYKQFNSHEQTWNVPCKLMEFLTHWNMSLSGLSLLLIAIDRYLAICHPIRYLHFNKQVYKGIIIVSCFSLLVSLPIFEFFGATPFELIHNGNLITVFYCHYQNNYRASSVLTAFGAFIMSCFLIVFVVMVILYKNVALTAYMRRRAIAPLSNAHILAGVSSTSTARNLTFSSKRKHEHKNDEDLHKTDSLHCHSYESKNHTKTTKEDSFVSILRTQDQIPCTSLPNPNNERNSFQMSRFDREPVHLDQRTSSELGESTTCNRTFNSRLKAAKILFCVSAVFFISWLPFLVLRMAYTADNNFWDDKSVSKLVIERLLNHFFYLNNAANPIIYTLINESFRLECKAVLKKTFLRG